MQAETTLAVVAAHRSGQPLHHELAVLGAQPDRCAWTAAAYRLVALPGPGVARGGLVAARSGGTSVEVELIRVPAAALPAFERGLPELLAVRTIDLLDGPVHGIVCVAEPPGSLDVSEYGSWPAYLRDRVRVENDVVVINRAC